MSYRKTSEIVNIKEGKNNDWFWNKRTILYIYISGL